ncbi:polysaccharide pyruvyl transferase family protein [Loktanella sp. IMCC34160]|uniref:polysaccharide pyruvyl transferase family protein n=1 Tax=Loktanella sp. IMCC34160 TaxID=2510646 RepID=UPI00101C465D|nr:polysaccharide pyruvyl transferase family protein [Loktanella sp. IMCC34160]RYG91533.1 polysaccharide pyruvyl transferase family protein [Loktanella sp. IMCC34160]
MTRAVLLNDTSARYHHGCSRVSRLLKAGLAARGVEITASALAHTDWTRTPGFLSALEAAELVVINGEGTLHGGAEKGQLLLNVVDHPAARGKPVAVVNTIWQNNPPDWADILRRCALVSARDSASHANLLAAGVEQAVHVPDLSLSERVEPPTGGRKGLVVGDSVRHSVRTHLARYAQRQHATFVPSKTLTSTLWSRWPARHLLWRVYNGVFSGKVPDFMMARDEAAYLEILSGAMGHVTGRFHGVCYSILAELPFLAVGSVTSKVQVLVADAGLNPDRVIPVEALADLPLPPPFDETELGNLRRYKEDAQDKAQDLFDRIARLA